MKNLNLILLIHCTLAITTCSRINKSSDKLQSIRNSDAFLTVPELIASNGYPVESHNIITEDGYNLTAHRIPYGSHCKSSKRKRAIWLQHGQTGSSGDFIIAGPDRALGYYFADNCYDVWLGNSRGNRYSREHVELDPDADKAAFWAFSFHEMGMYDLPASIDYVLNFTGTDGLYFVGHSIGCTQFFVLMSERPEYNSKIKLMNALAPAVILNHMRTPLRFISPFERQITAWSEIANDYEFSISLQLRQVVGQTVCHQNSTIRELCNNVLIILGGYSPDQLDPNVVPVILGHFPDNARHRSFVHLGQLISSGQFQKFDFGRKKNLQVYGSTDPPTYDLKKVTAPVAIYYGPNDWMAVPEDVMRFSKLLPNLQLLYRIKNNGYTHYDFLWARDNVGLLGKPMLKFLKEF